VSQEAERAFKLALILNLMLGNFPAMSSRQIHPFSR